MLDLTQFEAGPSCTEALAWLGADVVKVEEPNRGEPGRWGMSDRPDADSHYFIYYNLNKRSVTCNLKSEEGKALLRRMIAKADVLIENMAPGTFARLGFDYPRLSAINPRLIFAQVKGFAPESPHADYLSLRHDRPGDGRHDGRERLSRRAAGPAGPDHRRYRHRHAVRHGHPRRALPAHDDRPRPAHPDRHARRDAELLPHADEPPGRPRRRSCRAAATRVPGTAPGGLYKCAPGGIDDWCYIFASRGNGEHWRRLVKAIGREDLLDDPRMVDGPTRAQHREAVDAAITEWTSKRTKQEVTRDHRRRRRSLRRRA